MGVVVMGVVVMGVGVASTMIVAHPTVNFSHPSTQT